jgi:hypothetical protein
MIWWFQLIVVWLSIDVVIIATGWYAITTIKRYFPNWWERVIACEVEPDFNLEPELIETPIFNVEPEAAEQRL